MALRNDLGHIDHDPDGLYDKYRVFREPEDVNEHPVPLDSPKYWRKDANELGDMEEVRDFVFVLKPDSDYHARVAMAAYAESVQEDKPLLAQDIRDQLRDLR